MASTTTPKPLERIGARVPPDVFHILHQAAALTGATLNQFLVQAALKEARAVIDREQTLTLSRRDAERLLDLLENPPPTPPALAAAQARYQELKRDADSGFNWPP
jgi:uncharacterized protein (DUF1778 family)